MSLEPMMEEPAPSATAPVAEQPEQAKPAAEVAPKPEDSGSIFDGLDSEPPADKPTPEARWPENWREMMAGGDEDAAKLIARYQSPANAMKALVHAQKLIRSGELKRSLPKDAKPEDVAKWRKENGLPENPDAYEVPKIAGVEIQNDDPALVSFKQVAHAANLSADQFKAAAEWYGTTLREVQADQLARDTEAKAAAEDELRAEWGAEYRSTVMLTGRFLDAEFGELKGDILNARLPDGRRLGNVPELIKGFARMAAEADGGIGLVRGDATTVKDVDARLRELQDMMNSTDPVQKARYWSDTVQAEERELIARREKLNGR